MIYIIDFEKDLIIFRKWLNDDWIPSTFKTNLEKIQKQDMSIKEALFRGEEFNRSINWISNNTIKDEPAIFKYFHLNSDGTENVIYAGTSDSLSTRIDEILTKEKPEFLTSQQELHFSYSYDVGDRADRYFKRNTVWTLMRIHQTIYAS